MLERVESARESQWKSRIVNKAEENRRYKDIKEGK